MTTPRRRLDLNSCQLLADVADCLRLSGKQLLAEGVEANAGVALSRERIRLTDELLRWCADVSGLLAGGDLAEEERKALDRAVKDTTERARQAREFYTDLATCIEQGRKRSMLGAVARR